MLIGSLQDLETAEVDFCQCPTGKGARNAVKIVKKF